MCFDLVFRRGSNEQLNSYLFSTLLLNLVLQLQIKNYVLRITILSSQSKPLACSTWETGRGSKESSNPNPRI